MQKKVINGWVEGDESEVETLELMSDMGPYATRAKCLDSTGNKKKGPKPRKARVTITVEHL